jgi:hypothetical protein
MAGSGENALRAKYLDWCSARLAERFLDLSPEEIYALALPEAGESSRESGDEVVGEAAGSGSEASRVATLPTGKSRARLPNPTDEGYRVLVQRVTEALLRRTPLPTYEQWAEAYAEEPDRFEAELLGFWRDAVEEAEEGEASDSR